MKKVLFLACAAFALLMSACTGCNQTPEQKDDAVVIKTDNFEENVAKITFIVNEKYPTYCFYEAHGTLKIDTAGQATVDRTTLEVAFGCMLKNATVLATVVNDTLQLQEIDSPWLEDWHMTPFVPTSLQDAVEAIQKEIDIELNNQPVVLRHQLAPNIYEPQFIIGSFMGCHSITVFSHKIDIPATNGNTAAALKESGLEKK